MASIFTFDPNPPRVSSPWSASGTTTPQLRAASAKDFGERPDCRAGSPASVLHIRPGEVAKLEPEPQEGPTEYKLHLLLRPRKGLVSATTPIALAGSQLDLHSSNSGFRPGADTAHDQVSAALRLAPLPSSNVRQNRLEHLTTQLLWRLQQSSPYHSSSTASLVLPNLPEATPRLGALAMPARLLPGLEESQGALYEIGVSDDGTFVGLIEDELNESLTNLRAMAASLGCRVEVLRRVIVGQCEVSDETLCNGTAIPKLRTEKLWVAEALVQPDLENCADESSRHAGGQESSIESSTEREHRTESETEQIRVCITGASGSGKSSLLGTLSSSTFDNGRGKSRLSLLKHRHEISSGITSSVAHELIGYSALSDNDQTTGKKEVINYAHSDVSSWNDIFAAAGNGRLAFMADTPGMLKFQKSTLRGLISWSPHWNLVCVAANIGEQTSASCSGANDGLLHHAFDQLDLALRLRLPLVIAVTKLDLATREALRQTVSRILTNLKDAGKKPMLLAGSAARSPDLQRITSEDDRDVRRCIDATNRDPYNVVPIILSSAVTGAGIGKLHAFLRALPILGQKRLTYPHHRAELGHETPSSLFHVDEVFSMPPSKVYTQSFSMNADIEKGVVLCGRLSHGRVQIGDELFVGPIMVDTRINNDDSAELAAHVSTQSLPVMEADSEKAIPASHRSNVTPTSQLPRSASQSFISEKLAFDSHLQPSWQRVRVVSVRNLRLPVRRLLQDQVGTIGIELCPATTDSQTGTTNSQNRFGRLRKGMVLMHMERPRISCLPSMHSGFTAIFAVADFSPLASTFGVGSHVIVYSASIRAAARITTLERDIGELESTKHDPPSLLHHGDMFGFDDDEPATTSSDDARTSPSGSEQPDPSSDTPILRISFTFIASTEWLELGSQTLVVPTATPAAAVSSSANQGSFSAPGSVGGGTGAIAGLDGIVGVVVDTG